MIKISKKNEELAKTILFGIGVMLDSIILWPISLAILKFVASLGEKIITVKEND